MSKDDDLNLLDLFDFDFMDNVDKKDLEEILSIVEEKNLANELIQSIMDDDIATFTNIMVDAFNDSDSLDLHSYEKYMLDEDVDVSYDLDTFRVLSAVKEGYNEDYIDDFIDLESGMSWDFFKEYIISDGFMIEEEINGWKDLSSRFNVDELKDVLSLFDFKISGKKSELIERLDDNDIPYPVLFTLTDKGKKYLKDFAWIEYYENFLNAFDFSDFYSYLENHDDMDIIDLSLSYLEEHRKKAIDADDEDYIFACDVSIDFIKGEAKSLLKELGV